MCVEALDKSQLPTSYLHVDTMKRDGNYYSDVKFASMEQSEFNQFLKLNAAFGEINKNNYFFLLMSTSSFTCDLSYFIP